MQRHKDNDTKAETQRQRAFADRRSKDIYQLRSPGLTKLDCRKSGGAGSVHHPQCSPSTMFTIHNVHHSQCSPSTMFSIQSVHHPRPQSKRYSLISPPSHSPSHLLPAQTYHNNHYYLEPGHHLGIETTMFAIYLLFKEVREGLLLTAVEESFFTVRAPLCSCVSTQYIHFIQSNCLSHSISAKSRCSIIRNDGIHGCIDLSSL